MYLQNEIHMIYFVHGGETMKNENMMIRVSKKMKESIKESALKNDMSISEYIRFLYIQNISREEEREVE